MSNPPPQEGRPISIAGIEIPAAEQTPLVLTIVDLIARQQLKVAQLRDLAQKLRRTTHKPRPKPSKLLAPNKPPAETGLKTCRVGRAKKELERRVTETIPSLRDDSL